MQTPFEILQTKKRQQKKKINSSRKKQTFQLKSEYSTSINKSFLSQTLKEHYQPYKDKIKTQQNLRIDSPTICKKKYEIVFRESIRKFSNLRNRVYHNHNALKNQNFIKKFLTSGQGSKSQRNVINFDQLNEFKKIRKLFNPQPKSFNSEHNNTSPTIKNENKINLKCNQKSNSKWLNERIPEFCIQKCKIDSNVNQNKTKQIQKELDIDPSKLKQYKRNPQPSSRINTCEPVNRRFFLSTTSNIDKKQYISSNTSQKLNKLVNANNQSNYVKPRHIITEQILMISNKDSSELDENKVANFIKNKKKKRFFLLQNNNFDKAKNEDEFEFRRTITDNFINKTERSKLLQKIQIGYFSPNKKKRSNFNVKINSLLEDKIQGWEVHNIQSQTINEQNKQNFIQI